MADENKFYKSAEFKKLKNTWYQKLKKDKFEDIEWHDAITSDGENSPYLKSHFAQSYLGDRLTDQETLANSSQFRHQRAIDHFNANGVFEHEVDRTLWDLYASGATYRKMSQELRITYKKVKAYSVFWVSYRIKHLRMSMIKFNLSDPNGLRAVDCVDVLTDYEEFDDQVNGEEE